MYLKEYLELTGISYAEMGKKIGVHAGTIYRIANFLHEPKVAVAKKIYEATNEKVKLDDLADYWITYKEAKKIYG
jgi:transcriptional regulator with XRE-family HTH domain